MVELETSGSSPRTSTEYWVRLPERREFDGGRRSGSLVGLSMGEMSGDGTVRR